MQSANKGWWRDAKIHRCQRVPWKIKCQSVTDRVCSVFCSGCENWSCSWATMYRIKGWETTCPRILFRMMKKEDETRQSYRNPRNCG